MSAHRLRTALVLSLAASLFGATAASAQATKTGVPKAQEKAKAKAKAAAPADPIDVNSATADELAELPGVGEVHAKKIIEGRPYKTVDDLSKAGLSAAAITKIKPLATARPLPTAVEVNTATAERLQTLPGIGPETAKAIIDTRPYSSFDDLAKVKGLGEAKLAALRGRVSFAKAKVEEAAGKAKAKTEEVAGKAKAKTEEVAGKAKAKAEDVAEKGKAKAGEAKEEMKGKAEEVKTAAKAKAGEVKEKVDTAKGEAKAKVDTAKAKVAEKAKTAKAKLKPGEKININTATKDELDELFRIGPVRAQAIIDGRPYKTIDDIKKVKGIGDKIFDEIKGNISVE